MSPKALVLLTAAVVTVLSLLGTFLYGVVAGLRVALRFLLPLLVIAVALMLLVALLSRPREED
ncbi:MAG: hypothetical protein NZ953_00075 [Thaumarchaeota archaeon]|nr:hypothetical protein [Candidatus Calditenuaceae archaeon]MDW8042955.1 hypothetical protein [Nitrososphaerota archaeon]